MVKRSCVLIALALAGCAANHGRREATSLVEARSSVLPEAVAAALVGTWDNRAQYEAAPPALKVPPSVDGDWLDHQHARFARIEAPALGAHVLYLEWRSGGPAGPVSRQRIWSFRVDNDGAVRMDFYAFVDGAAWVGKADDPSAFRSLDAAALRGYGPQCALLWTPHEGGLRGVITADACTLTAASGRRMGITATVTLAADGSLDYQESGRLESGAWAFRVPPSQPYRFTRIRQDRPSGP